MGHLGWDRSTERERAVKEKLIAGIGSKVFEAKHPKEFQSAFTGKAKLEGPEATLEGQYSEDSNLPC